jgi:hypothetical protein
VRATNLFAEAAAYAVAVAVLAPPTLAELYERYMELQEEESAAAATLHAAEVALEQVPAHQAVVNARTELGAARQQADAALAAVKAATIATFQETGDRQPHPYAGILRIDTKPRYMEYLALQWVERRPDYKHLIVPASLDRRGFEKLARALAQNGIEPCYTDDVCDVPLVAWDEVPVVSVKIRAVSA